MFDLNCIVVNRKLDWGGEGVEMIYMYVFYIVIVILFK